jgi:hypothetical protein
LLKRGHDKVDKPDIDMVSKLADGFIEAYSIGPQIECKEELIVYMSLDE